MFCVTFYKPFIEHPRGTMNANLRFQDILILKKGNEDFPAEVECCLSS